MAYDFSTLSHTDFEDLSRDLIGRELEVRFEAFPEGRDDGMDGRYTVGGEAIILQAKHYRRSGFSTLKSKMSGERVTVEALRPKRYILTTSTPLTPGQKAALAEVIGPALLSPGDIFGPDDLNALLRKFPEIEEAHQKLWAQSTIVLKAVLGDVVEKALSRSGELPTALAKLLTPSPVASESEPLERNVIFLIKSSPVDDEFTLWLAPKLEAEGYRVFADILTLQPGDRWRREINAALQHRAVKVLLICRDGTLSDSHVQDDLDIALDVGKDLDDKRFIVPLRLEEGKKVKGLGDAVAVDFVRGWGEGLTLLLEALQRQKVPRDPSHVEINPNWELFRRRGAIELIDQPERLTSNWLRAVEAPDFVRYFESAGVVDQGALQRAVDGMSYPSILHGNGFITFANQVDVDDGFQEAGRFKVKHEIPLLQFVEEGFLQLGIVRQVASNYIVIMLKRAWYLFCKRGGCIEYGYSNGIGFHVSPNQAATGQRIPWGKQGDRRSSMLRNVAKGHIWQYGVTAIPALWPFWHFKLKSRVLFSVDNDTPAGLEIEDAKKLHRLRRTICKGWRNKVWYGRLLAFLELLSRDSAYIRLELSSTEALILEASPILFSSPVSTVLPDVLDTDEEELDPTTLGRPDNEEIEE